jgi:hypothetical protein
MLKIIQKIQVVEVDSFAAAIDKAKIINAQIVYVKTYSEACV